MAVPYKFIILVVGLVCALAVVIIGLVWMFKTIPDKSDRVNEQTIEVERLEKEHGIESKKDEEGEGEEEGDE